MRGREFIEAANWLESLASESSVRSQISRLYYAAYLEARAWCEQYLGYIRTQSSREHAEVPRLLRAQNPDLAKDLLFLRNLRNAADYDMHLHADTVALQLGDARLHAATIIARLDDLAAPGTDA